MPTDTPDLSAIRERCEKANAALHSACHNKFQLRASIPVEKDRDHDILISVSLEDIPALLAHIDRLTAERDAANKAIESLTPGGSEFYQNPELCRSFVREKLDSGHRIAITMKKRADAAEAEVKRLREAICEAASAPGKDWLREQLKLADALTPPEPRP